jgi:hypothetical protein
VRKGKKKQKAWWVQVESASEKACFSFSGAFKTSTAPIGEQAQRVLIQ